MATDKNYRKCVQTDKNSCINCDNYIVCYLSELEHICDDWKMVR